jgi:SAM-dependent methyltransferase
VSFAVAAEAYDRFVGRYSYALCDALAERAALAPGVSVLDVGAGSGVGTRRLVEIAGPGRVAAVDPSEPFVAALRERFPEADVRQGVAESLPFEDDSFDAALALLVVNFMADPAAGVAEMRRVTRPGGTVAACVWDYGGEMQLLGRFWDAVEELDPTGSGDADERSRMPYRREGELAGLLRDAGLDDVEDGAIVVSAEYESFEDLWEPYTAGVGPAGAYAVSLPADRQEALKALYRERLEAPEGPFSLTARAWYATGRA